MVFPPSISDSPSLTPPHTPHLTPTPTHSHTTGASHCRSNDDSHHAFGQTSLHTQQEVEEEVRRGNINDTIFVVIVLLAY